jgi:arylsulfatase A-like enzyme
MKSDMNRRNFLKIMGAGTLGLGSLNVFGGFAQRDKRPNIVLIMGDDIGFSDIGCYGAEINTPNLDRLAKGGIRFKQFYNMAKCNPTRSSLFTGHYYGNEKSISFVPLLREAGYSAMMSGKEHFDPWVPKDCYFANTFENSLTFWATTEYFVPPSGEFQRPFFLNGKQLKASEIEAEIEPKNKTDFITDYGLRWLDQMLERDKPFFLLLPYHAAHYPLQARPEDIEKYRGKYLKGWDKIRTERFERMKKMGILEADCKLSPPEGNTNKFRRASERGWEEIRTKFPKYYPWDSISEEEKDKKDLEMAVYAAMIDRMDQNIGRVLKRLEEAGQMENTLIMFFTDNGACPFDSNVNFDIPPGPAESYRCLSAVWANVGNTPFRLYKQNGHEGGANTHCIAHWPKVIQPNQITDQPAHLVDIFPTYIEIAGIKYPQEYNSKTTLPLHGHSLMPIFEGKQRKEPEFFISGNTERFRMYRRGDWKIVRQNNEAWELYNMENDLTEINNLADSIPEKVQELAAQYKENMANLTK